jgi:GntR family transcriptional regulator
MSYYLDDKKLKKYALFKNTVDNTMILGTIQLVQQYRRARQHTRRRCVMEFKTNIPIYLQVIEDIKQKIIAGTLPLGSKLPSSRELAIEYQINPNTAARIYSEMESMGLSYTRRGIGTFVTEDDRVIDDLKKERIEEIIQSFDEQLTGMGFSQDEILELLKEHFGK